MGKQINQYTKTRIKTSTQSDDLMDLDSTEDSGVTFESAKMKVSEFIGYILEQIPPLSLYVIDGTISANRTVTALGRFTKWVGGNITIKMADAINNYGFTIEDNLGSEKAEMGYDQSTSSGLLEVKNTDGTFINANDGKISVGTGPATSTALVHVKGKEAYNGAAEILLHVSNANANGNASLSPKLKIDSAGNFLSDGITAVSTINGSFTARHKDFRLTQFSSTGTSASQQGYQVFFSKSYGNQQGRTSSNGIGCDDLNPSWNTYAKLNIGLSTFSSGQTGLQIFDNTNHDYNNIATVTQVLANISKSQGNLTNSGTGESVLIGLDLDIENRATINYAALFNGGNVGIGTSTPNASAITEMSSTTQGFLKPVMTTAQRDAIATPADGLEIFNTSTAKMNFYDGDVWKVITSS